MLQRRPSWRCSSSCWGQAAIWWQVGWASWTRSSANTSPRLWRGRREARKGWGVRPGSTLTWGHSFSRTELISSRLWFSLKDCSSSRGTVSHCGPARWRDRDRLWLDSWKVNVKFLSMHLEYLFINNVSLWLLSFHQDLQGEARTTKSRGNDRLPRVPQRGII